MDDADGHGHVRPRPDGRVSGCGGPYLCARCKDEADAAASLTARLERVEGERDTAYGERAQLAAFLAAVYPSWLAETDASTPGWPVLTVAGPFGPMTWHVAPGDVGHFHHVRTEPGPAWDGHDTDEKYRRLAWTTAALAAQEDEDE